ncbi:formate dehydrogenase subunit delta [Chelativorans sp. M5D2P16]|uniref:formate dehydrogenase subunit delta n=1 Tax=Chelativorans sp. M5D2P16 TaxID=3095678 RepID=UPI002ACA9042|nr:formate dehydrogenase subunit delta [Chelativorans sp. M5D2P16]MDZ5697115.1 formate dehydrogenase subunit delta [Chelativorans sp. M5D2P16]
MSHEAGTSSEEKLVYMANQIAGFFQTMDDEEAVAGVADHINKFWEPRMRRQLFRIIERGCDGLKPLVLKAAKQINQPEDMRA